MTENEARQMEVEIKWNGRANVCVHCGKVPETYYITTGHDHTDDSIRYCFCRSVAPSIKQLQAKVAELEEEIERLRADNIAFARNLKGKSATTGATYEHICTQLAAEQLNNKLLREALEFLNARIVTMDLGGVVERALSLHASTEALDKYVAEKVKEAGKFDVWKTNPYTKVVETSIEQLTKQRDLAVEALEAIAGRRIFIDNLASNVDIAVMTLDTIKESEVK